MRLLCLLFPDLPIALARRAHPHLAERPIALTSGPGPEAVVTAVSPAAGRTIHPRMLAGEARRQCPGAMFLPDNAGACLDELERLAAIIRKYAMETVAVASVTALLVDISREPDERRIAGRIRTVARAWSGMPVHAGVGSTRSDAMEAAMASRRAIAFAQPRLVEEPGLRETAGPLSATTTLIGGAGDRRRVISALKRLAFMAGSYGWHFREVQLSLETADATRSIRLRFESPTDLVGAEDRIWSALEALPAGTCGRLTIALHRLSPHAVVEPLPTLAMAV